MNTQKIDDLIDLYEKRLATLRGLKKLIESDPALASEVVQVFMTNSESLASAERMSTTKKTGQYYKMVEVMKDGVWRTLPEIADTIGAKKHSIAPYLYKADAKDKFESRKHPEKSRMVQWRLKQKPPTKEECKITEQ